MTYAEAQIILDRCRAGAAIPLHQINQALELTGDLEHVFGCDAVEGEAA